MTVRPIDEPISSLLPLHRRGFVGAAGAAAVVGASPALALASAPRRRLSVGLLVPGHLSHAGAGQQLVAGFRLGLDRHRDLRAEVRRAEVDRGFAGAVGAASDLIDGGARVLVAGVAQPVVERLAGLCAQRGVALVAAGAGAHVVADRLPGVLQCTQQHWQSSFVMGGWAARHLDQGLFQIVAAPDAGYDSVYALRRGFQAAGGAVAGRAMTHDRPQGTGASDAALAARISGAGTVAVHATGPRVGEILRALRAARVHADVVVDGLGAEDFALAGLGRHGAGVYSASTWCRADATDFAKAYREATGRTADPFAAVGYDAATLVAAGARRLGGRPWRRLPEVLAGSRVEGSRGLLRVDARTRSVHSPVLVRRVRSGRNTVVVRRPGVAGVPPQLGVLERTEVAAYVNEVLGT